MGSKFNPKMFNIDEDESLMIPMNALQMDESIERNAEDEVKQANKEQSDLVAFSDKYDPDQADAQSKVDFEDALNDLETKNNADLFQNQLAIRLPAEDTTKVTSTPLVINEQNSLKDFVIPQVKQEFAEQELDIGNEQEETIVEKDEELPVLELAGVQSLNAGRGGKINNILQNYRNLRTAQQSQNNNLLNANLLAAGNKIAQGVASGSGAKIDDGSELTNALINQAELPVTQAKDNIKFGNEEELADPNTSVSSFYRDQAQAILMKLYPDKNPELIAEQLKDLSALQISKIPGFGKAFDKNGVNKPVGYGQFIDAKTNEPLYFDQETKKMYYATTNKEVGPDIKIARPTGYLDPVTGLRGYLTEDGMRTPGVGGDNRNLPNVEQGQQKEVTLAEVRKLDPNAYADFGKIQDKILTDMKETREGAAAMVTLASKLTPGPNGKVSSGLLGGIQTQAAKLAGQKGVLTDQDLVKFAGEGGVEATVARIRDGSFFAKMSDLDIKFFKRFSDLMGKSINQIIEDDALIHIARGRQVLQSVYPNINDTNVRQLLNVSSIAPSVQQRLNKTDPDRAKRQARIKELEAKAKGNK